MYCFWVDETNRRWQYQELVLLLVWISVWNSRVTPVFTKLARPTAQPVCLLSDKIHRRGMQKGSDLDSRPRHGLSQSLLGFRCSRHYLRSRPADLKVITLRIDGCFCDFNLVFTQRSEQDIYFKSKLNRRVEMKGLLKTILLSLC